MFSRVARVGLAGVLGAGLLAAGGAVPAQAKTVKACVKKSSGEMRLLTKKKCKKGWKKVTWNQKGKTGPQGNPGAQGTNLTVKDGTGKVLGNFLGLFPLYGPGLLFVEVDGGSYAYTPNGVLYPLGSSSPNFKNSSCTGTAYASSDSPLTTTLLTGSAGGPSRLVYRASSPSLGAAFAWQLTTTKEDVVNQQLWELNSTGACVTDPTYPGPLFYTGTLVALQSVAAPPDVPGPLKIG